MSFDGVRPRGRPIEVHGETGTLAVPDPNHFDGDVRLFALGAEDWETLPAAGYADSWRGFGLADIAAPRRAGSRERAERWPTTCWTSWSRCSRRRTRARLSGSAARLRAPRRLS